jgi:hypothetical protein
MTRLLIRKALFTVVVLAASALVLACYEPRPQLNYIWFLGPDSTTSVPPHAYRYFQFPVTQDMLQWKTRTATFALKLADDGNPPGHDSASFYILDSLAYVRYIHSETFEALARQENSADCDISAGVTAPGRYYMVLSNLLDTLVERRYIGTASMTYWELR